MSRRWGILNKTKWALYEEAPFTASGKNEVMAMGQTKHQMLALAGSEGIYIPSSGKGRWRIKKIEDMIKPVPPGPGEEGYVLTMDERFEFERRWDARVAAGKQSG